MTPEADGAPDSKDSRSRILIVDDDADYLMLLKETLDAAGCFESLTGLNAADMRTHDPASFDAIVLDYNLPDANGMDLLKEVLERCSTPVIMLTAADVVDTAVAVLKAGAYTYLVKRGDNLELLPEILRQAAEEGRRRTEHKEMQEQVERAARLAGLGTLAAGLCHEMNNPLAGILGYTDMYLSGYAIDPRRSMATIREAAARLAAVVESLASFASGSESPREKFDVVDLLQQELEKMAIGASGIELDFEAPPDPIAVYGNWPGCRQVCHQILRNARQAVRDAERKVVRVAITCDGLDLRLTVEDSGPGVSAAVADRIFDPFFTTREPGDGMGMGLAISHRIVTEHGGTIECEPSDLGGARFTVSVPTV